MSQQAFENYVKQGEASGVPRQQTQQRLIQNGWTIEPAQTSAISYAGRDMPQSDFMRGAVNVGKGLVSPALSTSSAIAARGFQAADYLAGKTAGAITGQQYENPYSPNERTQQQLSDITRQGIENIPDTLLTLGPLGGAKFSKLALPAAGLRFGINAAEGKPMGEAAMEAGKTYLMTKALGLASGPKSMAAIGAGLQTAGEVIGGQNPLSAEGMGGIAAAGGLGFLGGKAHEKGYNVGISEERPGAGLGKGMIGGEAKSLVSQFSGLRSESQATAFDPQTRVMTEGMLTGKTEPMTAVARIHETLNRLSNDVSDTGKEYDFVRTSRQVEPVPIDTFQNTLEKYGMRFIAEGPSEKTTVLGNPIQNGHLEIDPSGPGARMSPAAIDQIEAFMKFSGGVRTITPEVFKQAKSLLRKTGDFYDPQIPGGGGAIKGLAGELLTTLTGIRDKATTPDFQTYKTLDQKYAPKIHLVDELRGYFEPDPVTGDMRIKDTARGKILNALKGHKTNLVNDLERIAPGITRQIRAYETYQNIIEENKPGQYVRAGVKGVGVGYAIGGSAGAVIGGIAAVFASEPRVVFSLLSKIARAKEGLWFRPEEVLFKVERGMPLNQNESAAVKEAARQYPSTNQRGETVSRQQGQVEATSPTSLPEKTPPVKKTIRKPAK